MWRAVRRSGIVLRRLTAKPKLQLQVGILTGFHSNACLPNSAKVMQRHMESSRSQLHWGSFKSQKRSMLSLALDSH